MSDSDKGASEQSQTPRHCGSHGHHGHFGHHQHGHHAHQHGAGNRADSNRNFFNENTDIYDNFPHAKERGKRTALAIADKVQLDKDSTTVLEFACGNGHVSREFLPFVKSLVGIDISDAAVKRFNDSFESEGLADKAKAFVTNIETDQSVIEGQTFDLVYCASAFHHLDDPEGVTKILGSFLKPTGALVIVDVTLAEGADKLTVPEELKHIVLHAGFNKADISKMFEGAGLKLESYSLLSSDKGDKELFIAKGVRG
ncbi:S-adenosyl-L-methionine-dependent methyltransferase [Coprinopsis marcescibilis]|uniref:S-adenosyl-L-methionine-dependent methyltransferase n=1 Tax=Coprinopsis marcescibilis TaxID=230819 RepID=A0A5C3KDI0_COPMA|nr:S-adenosyl-L-methionine-dependent methyltransferase [Coprinopsis marcescibilis]